MSYRINYGSFCPPSVKKPLRGLYLQILTALFLLLFVLGVRFFWPEGHQVLQQILVSDSTVSTSESAFHDFLDDLHSGMSPSEAITAFCQDVIDHADLPG